MDFKKAIKEYYEREISVINRLNLDEINESMNAILDAYNRKGTIYICGNGGSASTASHFQNDFNKGISEYVDNKFNFYCLNDNVATIMAVANDIGYEEDQTDIEEGAEEDEEIDSIEIEEAEDED